jgi:hypothetical protein
VTSWSSSRFRNSSGRCLPCQWQVACMLCSSA